LNSLNKKEYPMLNSWKLGVPDKCTKINGRAIENDAMLVLLNNGINNPSKEQVKNLVDQIRIAVQDGASVGFDLIIM